tara:strand:+ start:255 stop:629 length:375 start_codon:yes stop_codon:yes gene_type:complete
MSMEEFIKTLSKEQKDALLKALSGGTFEEEKTVNDTGSDENFTMSKEKTNVKSDSRRRPVTGGKNTFVDTGEHRDVVTPKINKTPRNRPAAKKKEVKCHACGKSFAIDSRYNYGEFYRCDNCVG